MATASAVEMKPVNSLSIKEVGFEPETGTLHVRFASGGRYKYRGVSPEVHAAMLASDSIGKHFHQFVKPQYYGEKQEG